MWQRKNKYGSQTCSIGHMTLIFEVDLAIIKINMYAMDEDAGGRHQKVFVLTRRDRCLWNHYLPHYGGR